MKDKYHHDDYKQIRKDVEKVNNLLGNAYELDIDLDKDLVQEVNNFTKRLI